LIAKYVFCDYEDEAKEIFVTILRRSLVPLEDGRQLTNSPSSKEPKTAIFCAKLVDDAYHFQIISR